jgi:hypothetical protein
MHEETLVIGIQNDALTEIGEEIDGFGDDVEHV